MRRKSAAALALLLLASPAAAKSRTSAAVDAAKAAFHAEGGSSHRAPEGAPSHRRHTSSIHFLMV